ncbi:MAG: hypothetical protein Q7U57_09730 [Methylovulum sp.]|nr:hypothetical protein [Methylovulum sp.]
MDKWQPVWTALSYLSAWATTLLGAVYQFTSYTLEFLTAKAAGIGVIITLLMYLTNLYMQLRRDRREARLAQFYMQDHHDRRDAPLDEFTDNEG